MQASGADYSGLVAEEGEPRAHDLHHGLLLRGVEPLAPAPWRGEAQWAPASPALGRDSLEGAGRDGFLSLRRLGIQTEPAHDFGQPRKGLRAKLLVANSHGELGGVLGEGALDLADA